jgi:hypothetical protein
VARVQATGVRWLSKLELQPGRYQLRVAARSAQSGATGMITSEFEVPKIDAGRIEMSGITLTSLPAVLMITRADAWHETTLKAPPSAARTFVSGDHLTASVQLTLPGSVHEALEATASIEAAAGTTALTHAAKVAPVAGRTVWRKLDSRWIPPACRRDRTCCV